MPMLIRLAVQRNISKKKKKKKKKNSMVGGHQSAFLTYIIGAHHACLSRLPHLLVWLPVAAWFAAWIAYNSGGLQAWQTWWAGGCSSLGPFSSNNKLAPDNA